MGSLEKKLRRETGIDPRKWVPQMPINVMHRILAETEARRDSKPAKLNPNKLPFEIASRLEKHRNTEFVIIGVDHIREDTGVVVVRRLPTGVKQTAEAFFENGTDFALCPVRIGLSISDWFWERYSNTPQSYKVYHEQKPSKTGDLLEFSTIFRRYPDDLIEVALVPFHVSPEEIPAFVENCPDSEWIIPNALTPQQVFSISNQRKI